MKRAAVLVVAAMLVGGLVGCAPVIENHGYAPDDESVSGITAGEDTKGSVRRKIGRPSSTGVFDDLGWYYVSTTVERYMYHAPKVTERRVVAVEFDTNDTVASVNVYGLEDGRVIDLQTRTTPTHGRKLTILQQLLGNLGRFNEDSFLTQ
ncbi:MAG TPA: outer membrane protein assembly factor BamE [Thermohalobaculum sp.]|nr:outer membrane protein assembly factor BamE [Thermohalobaculum sp.]